MIARLWFGSTEIDKADAYIKHLRQTVFPELQNIEGHRGAFVFRKSDVEGVEFSVLTLWESMDAVRAFAGAHPETAVVPPEARALLRAFDTTVRHYDVVVDSQEAFSR